MVDHPKTKTSAQAAETGVESPASAVEDPQKSWKGAESPAPAVQDLLKSWKGTQSPVPAVDFGMVAEPSNTSSAFLVQVAEAGEAVASVR